MFIGLFGSDVFVRLPEDDRAELLEEEEEEEGTSVFEVMPGRPMKEYVAFPTGWRERPDKTQSWVMRSLGWAGQMPERPRKRRGNNLPNASPRSICTTADAGVHRDPLRHLFGEVHGIKAGVEAVEAH